MIIVGPLQITLRPVRLLEIDLSDQDQRRLVSIVELAVREVMDTTIPDADVLWEPVHPKSRVKWSLQVEISGDIRNNESSASLITRVEADRLCALICERLCRPGAGVPVSTLVCVLMRPVQPLAMAKGTRREEPVIDRPHRDRRHSNW